MTSARPIDANDRILYDKSADALSYDGDGSGSNAAVQLVITDTKISLSYHDFLMM